MGVLLSATHANEALALQTSVSGAYTISPFKLRTLEISTHEPTLDSEFANTFSRQIDLLRPKHHAYCPAHPVLVPPVQNEYSGTDIFKIFKLYNIIPFFSGVCRGHFLSISRLEFLPLFSVIKSLISASSVNSTGFIFIEQHIFQFSFHVTFSIELIEILPL